MAINLAKEGYPVTGYDVYTPLVDKLVAAGGKPSSTPADACKEADFVILMVANMHQINSVLFEGDNAAVNGIQKGKMIIICSTCPPKFLHELRKSLDGANRSDIRLIDCPVSGGTIRAANGTLSIFAAGPKEDITSADEVLNVMSGNLYKVEGGISSGTKIKTIHQLMAATNIISTSEAMGLAATVGLNTKKAFEHVKANDGTSFMFENRGPHMLADDWSPLSALGIIWKDAGIVCDAAQEIRFPAFMASTAEQLYRRGNDEGMLKDDDAKLVQMYLPSDKGSLVAQKSSADERINASHQVSADTVNDLLAGIHLAASVEALAFCKALGMDTKLMYEIISKAAGWCKMFTEHMPQMLEKNEWTLAHCKDADAVRERLVCFELVDCRADIVLIAILQENAVDKCRQIKYPCPMASMALQQFYFAGLRS